MSSDCLLSSVWLTLIQCCNNSRQADLLKLVIREFWKCFSTYIYIQMEFFHFFFCFWCFLVSSLLNIWTVIVWCFECIVWATWKREGLIVKREMFEFTADEMLWIKQSNPEYVSERSVTGSLLIMLFLSSDDKRFVV